MYRETKLLYSETIDVYYNTNNRVFFWYSAGNA